MPLFCDLVPPVLKHSAEHQFFFQAAPYAAPGFAGLSCFNGDCFVCPLALNSDSYLPDFLRRSFLFPSSSSAGVGRLL